MRRPDPLEAASARASWDDLFPLADYQPRLRMGRCSPEAYFGRWPGEEGLLAERARWIETAPHRHLIARPEAGPVIDEWRHLVREWEVARPEPAGVDPLRFLGTELEPDLVFLRHDADGPRMVAGAVCFPSSWAPESKLGLTVRAIHEIVPGLNEHLGGAIDRLLERLPAGPAWIRSNWGLSASAERNQHPERGLERLTERTPPETVRIRLEHQALVRLPSGRGLVFGIRIEQHGLEALRRHPAHGHALARALRSMPEPMARYKGIAAVRPRVIEYLAGSGGADED